MCRSYYFGVCLQSPRTREQRCVLPYAGKQRAWRYCGAALQGTSLTGEFAKSPSGGGSPPGSRVLWWRCVSVCQSVPGRAALGTRLPGTPVKAKLLVVQWLRVWHTTLLKTPYIPPRKQSDLPPGPHLIVPSPLRRLLLPPVLTPLIPRFSLPGLFFSLHYHHSFLSLSLAPSPPPPALPSILLLPPPPPLFPPLSNQHKMVLKLLLELQAAS